MFKKLTISSLVGVVTTLFSITTFSADTETAETHIANLVPDNKIYTVSANTTSNSAVLGGTVLPIKMVNLIAQMPGEVKYLAGEEGDNFEMGTTLVGLDRATLLEKRRAAVAGLRSAQAGLSNAHVQYTREKESPNAMGNSLLGGVPSMFTMFSDPMREFSGEGDPDYERYSSLYGQNTMIQTAKDQIEQARAGIAELDANLENLQSIAPFRGIIVKKMVEVGDIVQPGMPLVVFADTSIMQIQVEVPARLISSLNPNSVVSARLDRGTTLIPAKVSRIYPMASQGGHTTTVKFELPSGTGARAGMYAEILVPTNGNARKPLAVIPQTAISWRGSLPAVFAVSADKTSLNMRSLRLGSSSGNGMISIISGVSIGDKILKQPFASTRSGPYMATAQ